MKKILIILLSFCSIIGYGQLDITKRKVTLDSLNARQGVIHVNDSIKFGSLGARIHSIQATNDSLWFNTNLGVIAVPANLNDDIQALYDTAAVHLDTLQLHRTQITSILSDLDDKLNISDTTSMLDTYANENDTIRANKGIISKGDIDIESGKLIINNPTDRILMRSFSRLVLDYQDESDDYIQSPGDGIRLVESGTNVLTWLNGTLENTTDGLVYATLSDLGDTANVIRGEFPESADTAKFAHNVDSAKNDFYVGNRLYMHEAQANTFMEILDGDVEWRFLINGSEIMSMDASPNRLLLNSTDLYMPTGDISASSLTVGTSTSPTIDLDGGAGTAGISASSEVIYFQANSTDFTWNGSRLVTQGGDTAAWKSELGGGGSTDSSSITYELDTAKALNNSDIYFNPDVSFGGNVNLSSGTLSVNNDINLAGGDFNITFGGDILMPGGGDIAIGNDAEIRTNRLRGTNSSLNLSPGDAGIVRIRPSGVTSSVAESRFSTTLADLGTKAKFDSTVTFTKTEQVWDSIAFASTINVDFTTGSDYKMVVVTGACTINVTDLYGGESVLWIIQDGTGSHTVTKGTGWGDLRGTGTISTTADAISVVQWQKAVGPGTYSKVIHWID